MATNLEIIVGTYEEFLLGYKVEKDDANNYFLHQSFAVHAHIASIRTVHTKGKYLASGGADDRIYVYDMKKRQEIQLLTTNNGIVNHLRFTPDATHLFAADSNGALSATRTGSWITEGYWKAPHGGKAITHISIHPSGKLALTLGADLTLKTWNLIKGRQIFTTNLKSKSNLGLIIEYVEFCPSGQNFILSGAKAVEVWNIEKAGVVKEIACECKPTTVCWLDDQNLLIGLNNGKVLWNNLDSEECITFEMYDARVKGLYYQNDCLASISSNGAVTVWNVDIAKQEITQLCSANIGCRPICLAILNLADFSDEYTLKKEDNSEADEEHELTTKRNNKNCKATNGRQIGKVIVETDDNDDDDEAKEDEPKRLKKKSLRGDNIKTAKKHDESSDSLKQTTTPLVSKKQKRVAGRVVGEKLYTPTSTTKKRNSGKTFRSYNSSTFIEEDMV